MIMNFIKRLFKLVGFSLFLVLLTIIFYYSVMYGIKFMSYKQEVSTPNIKGEKVEDALRILHQNKLGMTLLEEQFSLEIAKGRIINQFPSPGVILKVDSNVRIIVSSGNESMTAPDLIDKTLKSAELTLDRFSLRKGNVAYTYSSKIEKDHVITQNPQSGSVVFKGEEINMMLSKGEEEKFYVMPDFIEKSLDSTIEKLKSMNLTLNRVNYQYNESYPDNIVINQSPELGYPVSNEIGVTLTVNQKVKKGKEENKFFIFSYVIPIGYKKVELELVLVTNEINKRTLEKGTYPPGYFFKHLVNAPVGSEIELLLDEKIVKRDVVE
jgi:eukaryotic-like serine/threonine-protein kinase